MRVRPEVIALALLAWALVGFAAYGLYELLR